MNSIKYFYLHHLIILSLVYNTVSIGQVAIALPLFSLQQYEVPQCDPYQVSHTITPPSQSFVTHARPLLLFTPPFDLRVLAEGWPHHFIESALIYLDARLFQHEFERSLLSLVQQGHVLALRTNALEAAEPEPQLLSELSVFETVTGLILPFYSATNAANATLPLFRIPPDEELLAMSNRTVLYNQHALDFVLQERRNSSSILSPLDLLGQAQLRCLLTRFECHVVAPSDLLFRICHAAARRLDADQFKDSFMTHMAPLLTYNDSFILDFNRSSAFNLTRTRVAEVVKLAATSVSEHQIRTTLLHPHLVSEHSVWKQYLWTLLSFCPIVCNILAVSILVFVACKIYSERRLSFLTGARYSISKAFANRAKVV